MGTDHNFAVMLFLLLFSHMVVLISATTLGVNDACEPAVACEDGEDCYLQPVDAGTRPCQPNPCHNGGVCETAESHFQGYLCHCTPGYVGVHCQHNVNECESDPCQNGGVCNDLEANYTCVCPGEYVGHNCQHKCSGSLGMEGGIISDAQFSASSIDSTMFGLYRWHPRLARLNRKGMVNAWSPADTDPEPWIQVNLRQRLRITGVITQGARRLGSSEFVKTFKVAYSQDGRTWKMMKVKGINEDMVFNGNIDHSAPMANVLSPSFEAQYVRLYPKLCRGHCTLRMELLGCDLTGCTEPLGLKSGELTDSQMSASSVYRTLGMGMMSWGPEQARLDRRGKVNAWSAAVNDHSQWIQVDLLSPNNITAVITQGARDFGRVQFIKSFKVAYSSDGITWTVYQDESAHTDKVFQGNTDNDTHKKNRLEPNIYGRFLRLIPWSWSGRITLRMELLGCSEKQ